MLGYWGKYQVNIAEGRIYSTYSGTEKEIGYKRIINGYEIWKVYLYAEKKRYFFQVGEIVAYLVNMFTNVEEPEKYIVITLDKSERPHMYNIKLEKLKDLGIETRFKKKGE